MTPPDAVSSDGVEEPEYYFEGPYIVFTAAYHRKRGYCCNSSCRHCPFTEEALHVPDPISD